MGVNMAGNCIIDDEVCRAASCQEIIRRYYKCLCDHKRYGETRDDLYKLELLMQQAGITIQDRTVACRALLREEAAGNLPAAAKIACRIKNKIITPMITKWRRLCMTNTPANSRIIALGK